jgi:hypothetical protein
LVQAGDGVWAEPDRRAFIATVTTMALVAPLSQAGIAGPVPRVAAEPLRQVGACDVDRIETVTQAFRLVALVAG